METIEKSKGLYRKYIVSRADQKPNENEEYFVLRLDNTASDKVHVEACRKAVLVYANEIKNHLPELAIDIIKRYGKEEIQVCPHCGADAEERFIGDEGATFCTDGCGCIEGEKPVYRLPS